MITTTPNKEQKQQLTELNKELAAQQHASFLQSPYAKQLLIDLKSKRDLLLNECMNLSVSSPINTDMITTKLVRAKQLTETIQNVETIRPA